MRPFLKCIQPLLNAVLPLDILLGLALCAYCFLAPASFSMDVNNGFFAFLGFFGMAFCQAQLLRKQAAVFTLAARLPFRYDLFFLLFALFYSLPVLAVSSLAVFAFGSTDALFYRFAQGVFALVLIKILSLHLFILIRRGMAWLTVYFTLQIALLYVLILAQDFLRFPDAAYAALYLAFNVLLIALAVRKRFHLP